MQIAAECCGVIALLAPSLAVEVGDALWKIRYPVPAPDRIVGSTPAFQIATSDSVRPRHADGVR
jgi:hypothetical protein